MLEQNEGDGWSIVPSPTTPRIDDATLNGVDCLDAGACWAVGFEQAANGSADDQPLIEQNTGSGWAIVSTPASRGGESLEAVTCTGASDCWAVGFVGKTGSKYQTLIEETGWELPASPTTTPAGQPSYQRSGRVLSTVRYQSAERGALLPRVRDGARSVGHSAAGGCVGPGSASPSAGRRIHTRLRGRSPRPLIDGHVMRPPAVT